MLVEKIMFTCICDNCKKNLLEGADYSCVQKEWIEDEILNSDWHIEGDKHFCNDCFNYDDNDELIINKERFKT